MKMHHLRVLLSFAILISTVALCRATVNIRVTGDNVNLRSGPTNASEVVGQVSTGEILQTTGSLGGWLQVIPPDKVDFWIYDEFIVKDKVAVSRLRVRGGPGINYRPLGILDKGDKVVSRGIKGEWRKIEPPKGCYLWISIDYADVINPHKPTPVKQGSSDLASVRKPPKPSSGRGAGVSKVLPIKVKSAAPTKMTSSPKPTDLHGLIDMSKLQKDVGQGVVAKRTGVIKPSGMVWRRPSKFRLVMYDKWDRAVTICYVVDKQSRLSSVEGQDVYIVGHEYWIQGVRYPVVVVDQLILNN
jgi:uncharacterized protein YraI